jgi:hypothetical protein
MALPQWWGTHQRGAYRLVIAFLAGTRGRTEALGVAWADLDLGGPNVAARGLRAACKAAGVPVVGPPALSHAHASALLADDWDLAGPEPPRPRLGRHHRPGVRPPAGERGPPTPTPRPPGRLRRPDHRGPVSPSVAATWQRAS